MNNSKYNNVATVNTLTAIFNEISDSIKRMDLANMIAKKYNGKVYVHIDGDSYRLFIKVDRGTYFCIKDACCYDINDNFMEHDPHVYEWNEYRKNYPGKALVIEDCVV